MLNPQKWISARKQLYLKLRNQVRIRLGDSHERLAPYHQTYNREFGRPWSVSSSEELMTEIMEVDVVCIADFHSLSHSQKVQLKLLKQWSQVRSIVLAVEFFESRHQEIIDQFMNDEISESKFLESINWAGAWGFPWPNYRILISWAKENGVRVVGINKHYKQRSVETLAKRDQHSAKIICSLAKENQDLVMVIYGELHLTRSHLPKEIRSLEPKIKLLRVFQNSEKIYFQLAKKGLENEVDLVRMGRGKYCVMSVPPWIKWQSYLMSLEQLYDSDFEGEEAELDYTDIVGRQVGLLAEAIGQQVSLDRLSVYLSAEEDFTQRAMLDLSRGEERALRGMIAAERSFYLPGKGIAVLARPTLSHVSLLAAQYTHAELSNRSELQWQMPKYFLQQVWIQAATYFGAKLLNPKRKTPMLVDLQLAVKSGGDPKLAKEAISLALDQKMRDLLFLKHERVIPRRLKVRTHRSYMEAARLLGGILGEKLYAGYHKRRISQKVLISMLMHPVEVDDFEDFYYTMITRIEPLRSYFRSKEERL